MTVGELLRRMSNRELEEWKIMHTVFEPIGPLRDDLRSGNSTAALINMLRSLYHYFGGSPMPVAKPSDYLVQIYKEPSAPVVPVAPKVQSPAEMKRVMMAIKKAWEDDARNIKRKRGRSRRPPKR